MRERIGQIGNGFFNKRTVVVYRLGDNEYEFRVEMQTGVKLPKKAIVTKAQYEAALTRWQNGCTDEHDPRITQRALSAMETYCKSASA
jgi:hypothetical protein